MRADEVCRRLLPDDSEPDRHQAVKAGAVAPPLRGFGLDGLTPPRFGLFMQTKADWGRGRGSDPKRRGNGARGAECKRNRSKINQAFRHFAAHNGLVAGSGHTNPRKF
ncbi:hypothetical protein LMTR13_04860 [Bradyrhizobium icense]|uniref:Uncharacterized protein n=1 Tax=Bradyrhizobium icense TaxID=1274631 RepID=A0A1B1UA13_9BRAD|nr:hypothetical protein LMTR13_04860 [Bradyrhizobium icense]